MTAHYYLLTDDQTLFPLEFLAQADLVARAALHEFDMLRDGVANFDERRGRGVEGSSSHNAAEGQWACRREASSGEHGQLGFGGAVLAGLVGWKSGGCCCVASCVDGQIA